MNPPLRLAAILDLSSRTTRLGVAVSLCFWGWGGSGFAQEPRLSLERLSNQEAVLRLAAPAGETYRIDASSDLRQWDALVTFLNSASFQHTDTGARYRASQFYRAALMTGANVLTGDHLTTGEGSVVLHPINHATLVMRWNDKMIYVDPVGATALYQGMAKADLILVTHQHGDHFNSGTIAAVRGSNATIIAPQSVYGNMDATLRGLTRVLANGARTNVLGLEVEAVPAYNLTTSNHPRGQGNGYVVTIGGKRIYFSGDSEDIPEMRALPDIDVAFVCMNVPYTMNVDKAISAVRSFRPAVVYPYHYRNQDGSHADLNRFKSQVGTDLGIEVRLRNWY